MSRSVPSLFKLSADPPVPGRLERLPCLGLLPGSASPHYDGEPQRRPAFQALIADGMLAAGYGIDDGAALHFIGMELHQVVSSRPRATGYRVCREDGRAVERPLANRYLGEDRGPLSQANGF